mgnify:CR=1 FL=1
MATTEEIEKYCRNCVSRDFVNGKGLVCSRTRDLPAFKEECESFQKDEELEKQSIIRALQSCSGIKTKAAQMLNVDSSTLYRKMKKYGIK